MVENHGILTYFPYKCNLHHPTLRMSITVMASQKEEAQQSARRNSLQIYEKYVKNAESLKRAHNYT